MVLALTCALAPDGTTSTIDPLTELKVTLFASVSLLTFASIAPLTVESFTSPPRPPLSLGH
jgi:hypothetical protein